MELIQDQKYTATVRFLVDTVGIDPETKASREPGLHTLRIHCHGAHVQSWTRPRGLQQSPVSAQTLMPPICADSHGSDVTATHAACIKWQQQGAKHKNLIKRGKFNAARANRQPNRQNGKTCSVRSTSRTTENPASDANFVHKSLLGIRRIRNPFSASTIASC